MKKIVFILGLAIGYVLGARAGRERYEQIASIAGSIWQSKPVQRQVGKVEAGAKKVGAKVGDAALEGVKKLGGSIIDQQKSTAPRSTEAGR